MGWRAIPARSRAGRTLAPPPPLCGDRRVSALPAFATVSVVLVSFYHLNPVAAVLIAMAQGMVGFALLLDGAAWLFRKRIGLPAHAASDTSHG
jgi:H+/gluconate symporter-like permease